MQTPNNYTHTHTHTITKQATADVTQGRLFTGQAQPARFSQERGRLPVGGPTALGSQWGCARMREWASAGPERWRKLVFFIQNLLLCKLSKQGRVNNNPSPALTVINYWPVLLHLHPHLGEGAGDPLQYSCLENPTDGAWWAAVHGVARSQTRLSSLAAVAATYPHLHPNVDFSNQIAGIVSFHLSLYVCVCVCVCVCISV